jgi:hypothetical protein
MTSPRLANVPTRPWATILKRYEDLEHLEPSAMVRLVRHIVSAPYCPLLFGLTSMHVLIVSQHEKVELGHDVLRVEQLSASQVRFTFEEQPFVKPAAWDCPADKIVDNFEGFLRKAKWVTL